MVAARRWKFSFEALILHASSASRSLGQRGTHGLLGRALAELDVEIGIGHAQHVQRGAQALHVLVGAVVGGHDEQARAVVGTAVDDAGGVELELRLHAHRAMQLGVSLVAVTAMA